MRTSSHKNRFRLWHIVGAVENNVGWKAQNVTKIIPYGAGPFEFL